MPAVELLPQMGALGVGAIVDAGGGWGEEILNQRLDHFTAAAPDRFFCFGGVPWEARPEHPSDFTGPRQG